MLPPVCFHTFEVARAHRVCMRVSALSSRGVEFLFTTDKIQNYFPICTTACRWILACALICHAEIRSAPKGTNHTAVPHYFVRIGKY